MRFGSLEPKVFDAYMAAAGDFVSFAEARGFKIYPCRAQVVAGYLYAKFVDGQTARSIPSVLTKLRYFYLNILEREWMNTSERQKLSDAVKTLQKFDFTVVKKSLPLSLSHLVLIRRCCVSPADRVVFAALALAYQAMARLGEITNAKVRLMSLYHHHSGFYLYFYRKPPKAHKSLPAPCCMLGKEISFCVWSIA